MFITSFIDFHGPQFRMYKVFNDGRAIICDHWRLPETRPPDWILRLFTEKMSGTTRTES